MGRKKKLKKLLTENEREIFKRVQDMVNSIEVNGACLVTGLHMISASQRIHEFTQHDGQGCTHTRHLLVARIAQTLNVISVEDFTEIELLAAKLEAKEPINFSD
jgi:hypothetical protein